MKIALVGSAPSSVMLAPYKDASYAQFIQGKIPKYPPAEFIDEHWEIWACSPGAYGQAMRMTRFFEVHRWEPGVTWFSPEYCQFLREFRGPVYVGAPIPEIKNAVLFPTERVELEFSPYFLTSSLSLMFAVAILEIEARRRMRASARAMRDHILEFEKRVAAGASATATDMAGMDPVLMEELLGERDQDDTIGMWGVDMSAGEEWEYQRPGCQFFILEALRRGICVFLPPESDVMHPQPIYGVSEWDPKYIKATVRARELSTRAQHHAAQASENTKQAQYLQGAIDNMNYFIKTHMSDHGLPHGIFLRHQPGSGLGAGVTPFGTILSVSDDGERPSPIGGSRAEPATVLTDLPEPLRGELKGDSAARKAPEAGKAVRTTGPAKKKKPARTKRRR